MVIYTYAYYKKKIFFYISFLIFFFPYLITNINNFSFVFFDFFLSYSR